MKYKREKGVDRVYFIHEVPDSVFKQLHGYGVILFCCRLILDQGKKEVWPLVQGGKIRYKAIQLTTKQLPSDTQIMYDFTNHHLGHKFRIGTIEELKQEKTWK
ncbi:MAG: hypothetical protein GY754_29160 [bacterium]|nr:hypothetical protein [bacterium]